MAENKPRIDFEGRTKLEEVIPLSTPYLVFLDPSSACNARCQFCPTGHRDMVMQYRKPHILSFNSARKIIDDLCEMPEPIKTLRLYKDGEPLLNQRLDEIVEYAKGSGRFGSVDTTTNGVALTPVRGRSLVNAGLDKIFISVPAHYTNTYADQIRAFIDVKGDCEVRIKMIGNGLQEGEIARFYADFCQADRIFIENLINCWPRFDAGIVGTRGIYNQPLTFVNVCPYLFYSLSINAEGSVSACFLDWNRTLVVGSLKEDKFADVWNGASLKSLRILHLEGLRYMNSMCKACGQLTHGAPDNLEPFAEELLKRFQ